MKFIGIIPARYGSKRFPGKLLRKLGDKVLLQHVFDRVSSSGLFSKVIVATDDHRIAKVAEEFGAEVQFTREHESGTDRCLEVMSKVGGDFDGFLNIQGDEPFVDLQDLKTIISILEQGAEIASLKLQISLPELINDPNVVKVVCEENGNALYFSRAPIPFQKLKPVQVITFKHVGIYGFAKKVLEKLPTEVSDLERTESLEQLRWLEAGLQIKMGLAKGHSVGVDTVEDLERAERYLKKGS